MNLQRDRRHDPYPWTWEIPLAVTAAIALTVIFGIHVGRSAANLAAGGGLQFTPQREVFTSIGSIVGGNAAAGLPTPPVQIASGRDLAIWILLTEAAVLPIVVWGIVYVLGRWGPSRVLGMATPADAEDLLGLNRLRRNAAIIRPDLYSPKRGRR